MPLPTSSSLRPPPPKWISVDERLPEESGRYLVYTYDDRIIDAYYSEEAGKWRSYSVVIADKRFTHWMPMTEPPKEVERCLNVKS